MKYNHLGTQPSLHPHNSCSNGCKDNVGLSPTNGHKSLEKEEVSKPSAPLRPLFITYYSALVFTTHTERHSLIYSENAAPRVK